MFVKRPDPHEEALMILKGQMSHLAAAPGTQVRAEAGRAQAEWKTGASREPRKPAAPKRHGPAAASSPAPRPLSTLFGVGAGAQGGCGPGEASDQRSKAIHATHTR